MATPTTPTQTGLSLIGLILAVVILITAGIAWKVNADKERKKRIEADHQAAMASLTAIDERLVDAFKLAAGASRITLTQPIASLQQIRRDASELTLSPCLDEARKNYVSGIAMATDGFINFQQNHDETEVKNQIEDGIDLIKDFRDRAPICQPGL